MVLLVLVIARRFLRRYCFGSLSSTNSDQGFGYSIFFANHQVWQCAKLSLANHTLCTSPFTFTWQLSCATQSYLYPWILLFRYLTQPIADNNIILPVHVVLWNILHYGGTAHTCGIITDDALVYSSHIPVITQYNVISYCTQRCNGQEVTAFP